MSYMQRTAFAVTDAVVAGKARAIRAKVSSDEIGELGLMPNDCHANAEKFASARGGEVVRGWLAGPNYCIPHSVVELEGMLHETTPVDGALYDACVFVAEKDVPGAVWNSAPAVLFKE